MKDVFVIIKVRVKDDVTVEEARVAASDLAGTMVDQVRGYARQVYGAEVEKVGIVV